MLAYKLFRQLKSGEITSLFINNTRRLPLNEWLNAECYPTKGFSVRPYWHCTEKPEAPHLTNKGRIWFKIDMEDFEVFERPVSQGGKWFLAKKIKIIN